MEELGTNKRNYTDAPFTSRFSRYLSKDSSTQVHFKETDFRNMVINSLNLCQTIEEAEFVVKKLVSTLEGGIYRWWKSSPLYNRYVSWPPDIEIEWDKD